MDLFKSYLVALLCAILGAGYTIAGKLLVSDESPINITFLRIFIAFICFLPFTNFKAYKRITRYDIILLCIAGISGIFLTNVLYFKSLESISALEASLLNALVPVLLLLTTSIIVKKAPTFMQMSYFMVGLIGTLIMTTEGNMHFLTLFENKGNAIMLCSVIFWVIFNLAAKYKSEALSSELFTFGALFIGLVPLTFLSIQSGIQNTFFNLGLLDWILLLYISALATGLGYYLNTKSVELLGPDTATYIIYSTTPIFVMIFSYLLFGESITIWKLGGSACILLSLLMHTKFNNARTNFGR